MGAPKQKWSAEEEAALRAGVVKHGAGKWRTILKDPEFSGMLCLRSNVDLKDKWRNMSVTAIGCSSREKGRMVLKRNNQGIKHEDDRMSFAAAAEDTEDDEIHNVKPLAVSHGPLPTSAGSKKPMSRLENLILEAITNLKEPTGSNKTTIAMYLEDEYYSVTNFKHVLSVKLKELVARRKLIKASHNYKIAPKSEFPEGRRLLNSLLLEGTQTEYYRKERDEVKQFSKSQVDAELARIKNMNAQEAAAAAAQAVAEAEAAMAEAEEAAREAETAEADAEDAKAFVEAAMLTLRNPAKMMMEA